MRPLPPRVDAQRLQSRLTSLRTLAEGTDGLAILASNDLAAGLKRVVSDLTSYYLLGYYSTGKLDGKFHPITASQASALRRRTSEPMPALRSFRKCEETFSPLFRWRKIYVCRFSGSLETSGRTCGKKCTIFFQS